MRHEIHRPTASLVNAYEIPGSIVDEITDGVPAVRAFRRHARQSLTSVSEHTGIGSTRLHSLETGAPAHPEEILLLAVAFGVPAYALGDWH